MTLSVTAVQQLTLVPTVKLTATSTTGTPNPVPNNTLVDVWRVHADGTRHRVLTDQGPRLIGGGWVWLDIHCPYNQSVTYQVTANGFTVTSAPVWLPSQTGWLLHPARADLAAPVGVVEKIGDRGYDSRAGKFTPVGGLPIFLTDGARDASAGTMVLRVTDETPYKALFADDEVILINTPGLVGWDVRWMWVQPGTVTYGNKGDQVRYPYRSVTIPYRESADPDKDFEPAWTYGDAKTYWGSQGVNYGALKTKYATYLDLKTDTRI